jgi:hypothetical protein
MFRFNVAAPVRRRESKVLPREYGAFSVLIGRCAKMDFPSKLKALFRSDSTLYENRRHSSKKKRVPKLTGVFNTQAQVRDLSPGTAV